LLLIVSLASACAWAADKPTIQLYRYVDNRGVTVLDTQGVPAEYIGKGYQILNQQGRVIQTVPPAPTADEIKRQDALKAQADADAQLLHQFPSLQELDRGHAREQSELDTRLAVARNNLDSLQSQQSSLLAQAAAQQRASQPVQPSIVAQLASIDSERANLNAQLLKYQQQKLDSDKQYAVYRARLVQLLGQ
jgi:hypothetical protein